MTFFFDGRLFLSFSTFGESESDPSSVLDVDSEEDSSPPLLRDDDFDFDLDEDEEEDEFEVVVASL